MEFLHEFFELNRGVIYFGYGLVFFVLGLAIALQSRQYSRLDLARSLTWLSAFGFTHAFHEWGDLFIPIQAAYLSPGLIHLLEGIHLFLLAVSFTLLFEFGVSLLREVRWARWLHLTAAVLLAVWIFTVYFPLDALITDFNTWRSVSNALARYFIGFPGALLAAYSLRQHAKLRIEPLNVPHIFRMLRFSGWMLALYAILSGLIVPPIPFFPGNLINSATFEQALGAPPPVFRSLVGLGLAVAIIRALEVFDLETARMIEAMEQKQILATERERLARELHDGAIQKVYTAGLLVESAYKLVEPDHPVLIERLEKAVNVLDDAIRDLRRNLGELHTTPGEVPLPEALRLLAEDPRFESLVEISLEISLPEDEPLSPVRSGHVLAVVNEALSNVIRHARARHVKISACEQDGRLILTVEDDGISIPRNYQAGFGLRNMRDRARLLGGTVEFRGASGKGTRVVLDIPWRDER